jgi:hypothetical protein
MHGSRSPSLAKTWTYLSGTAMLGVFGFLLMLILR